MPRQNTPRPGAVVQITDAEGRMTEYHSFTCNHCGNPKTVVGKLEDVADVCRGCWRLICATCADHQATASHRDGKVCTPFEAKIEAAEARHQSLKSMGLA